MPVASNASSVLPVSANVATTPGVHQVVTTALNPSSGSLIENHNQLLATTDDSPSALNKRRKLRPMTSSEAIHFDNTSLLPGDVAISSLVSVSDIASTIPASLIRTHEVDSSDAAQSTSTIKKLRLNNSPEWSQPEQSRPVHSPISTSSSSSSTCNYNAVGNSLPNISSAITVDSASSPSHPLVSAAVSVSSTSHAKRSTSVDSALTRRVSRRRTLPTGLSTSSGDSD